MSDESAPKGEGTEAPLATEPAAPAKPDVVFVRGPSADGRGLDVVRLSNDTLSAGELREAKDGQPLAGDLVRLSQRSEHDRLYDVEVLAKKDELTGAAPATPSPPRKGPSKVATDAYRRGWDEVFGKRDAGLN